MIPQFNRCSARTKHPLLRHSSNGLLVYSRTSPATAPFMPTSLDSVMPESHLTVLPSHRTCHSDKQTPTLLPFQVSQRAVARCSDSLHKSGGGVLLPARHTRCNMDHLRCAIAHPLGFSFHCSASVHSEGKQCRAVGIQIIWLCLLPTILRPA